METTLLATRTCATCPEFQGSDRTPNVGCCLLHECKVLGTDKACSHQDMEKVMSSGTTTTKLQEALEHLESQLETGKDFADAHFAAVWKFKLSDEEGDRLLCLYDLGVESTDELPEWALVRLQYGEY